MWFLGPREAKEQNNINNTFIRHSIFFVFQCDIYALEIHGTSKTLNINQQVIQVINVIYTYICVYTNRGKGIIINISGKLPKNRNFIHKRLGISFISRLKNHLPKNTIATVLDRSFVKVVAYYVHIINFNNCYHHTAMAQLTPLSTDWKHILLLLLLYYALPFLEISQVVFVCCSIMHVFNTQQINDVSSI